MSAPAAFIRRSVLTGTRFHRFSPTTRIQQPLYQPLYTHLRQFSATMSKQGVHNLENKADFDAALKEQGLMVLDCFATWCGPCKVIAPQVVK